MNDFFDPTNPESDTSMHTMLQTLPEAPDHDAGFWAKLDSELAAAEPAAPARRSFNGRSQFLLVAAALVVVAGVIGLGLNSRNVGQVDTADDPTTTIENSTPDTTAVDGEPEPNTTVPVDANDERATSSPFLYDVAVPEGFSVDYADGRGVSLSNTTDPFGTYLQVTNFVGGDEGWRTFTQPYSDDETAGGIASITTPLFNRDGDNITESAQSIEATQYEYFTTDRSRWVRVYEFDDRTIVAEFVYSDPSLIGEDLTAPLDGIRHFTGGFEPIESCSTNGLAPVAAPAELNAAQAARFDGIMTALVTCDWDLLEGQLAAEFFPTVGGGDAIEIWTSDESFGTPILKTLYDHMSLPVGVSDDGANWPRGWSEGEPLDAETEEALRGIGYTDEDFASWEDFGGYISYRLRIGTDGDWTFFVAGD